MVSNSSNTNTDHHLGAAAAGKEQPEAVLRTLVAAAKAAINAQWEPYAKRIADAMFAHSEQGSDGKLANLSFNAANLLRQNSYPFAYLASDGLRQMLQADALKFVTQPTLHAKTGATDQKNNSAAHLSLVPFAEIEQNVLLGKATRPIDAKYDEQLVALNLRLAALFGRDELALADNPFRPELVVRALHDAWHEFNPDLAVDALVLQLLDVTSFIDLAPVFAEINQQLISLGILPELAHAYRIRKSAAQQELNVPDGHDGVALMQKLQQMFAPASNASTSSTAAAESSVATAIMNQAAATVPAAGFATSPDNQVLFNYLVTLQTGMLERRLRPGAALANGMPNTALLEAIKQQTPAGTLSRMDENTLDLLTRVFDVIFDDQHIPLEIKKLIGYLQVPVLKAALVDKGFFFNGAHPARRMIDVLSKSGVAWEARRGEHAEPGEPGRNDPLFQILQRNVERVQRDFGRYDTVFADVVAELESFIRADEVRTVSQLAAPIDQALHQEKLSQATKQAKNQEALRIGTGEVLAFVETFLESKWVPVLAIAYSRAERQPTIVDRALKTMDDLIWSVKPKITADERRQLISRLPSMLAALNQWLNLIEWEDADRLRFFAELAECHAPINLTPERQFELALEVAQQAAERRLEKQAAAENNPEPPPDQFAQQVSQLKGGDWFEFDQDDAGEPAAEYAIEHTVRRVKLAWVSPMRSFYIFTTTDRKESFSMADNVLAQALRAGRASLVPASGILDRALCQALESIVANDPLHVTSAVG